MIERITGYPIAAGKDKTSEPSATASTSTHRERESVERVRLTATPSKEIPFGGIQQAQAQRESPSSHPGQRDKDAVIRERP